MRRISTLFLSYSCCIIKSNSYLVLIVIPNEKGDKDEKKREKEEDQRASISDRV